MAKALERFGTLKWHDVMAPALALARRGMQLDWYMQVMIANGAEHLAKFPASKAAYLPDSGRVPTLDWQANVRYLKLGNLGETYQRLCDGGPREFYEGALARDIAATCRPAARRSTMTISEPTRRASSSRCRSSMATPSSTSRAA